MFCLLLFEMCIASDIPCALEKNDNGGSDRVCGKWKVFKRKDWLMHHMKVIKRLLEKHASSENIHPDIVCQPSNSFRRTVEQIEVIQEVVS